MSHTWLSKGLDVYMKIHTHMKQAHAFRNTSPINTQKILLTVYTYYIHENWVLFFWHTTVSFAHTNLPCLTHQWGKNPIHICTCIHTWSRHVYSVMSHAWIHKEPYSNMYMYTCMYVYVHICECTHTWSRHVKPAMSHTWMSKEPYSCMYMHTHLKAGICVPPCLTHTYVKGPTHICTCKHLCVCVYIYTCKSYTYMQIHVTQAYVFCHASHMNAERVLLTYVHAYIYVHVRIHANTYTRATHICTRIHTWCRHIYSSMPHT